MPDQPILASDLNLLKTAGFSQPSAKLKTPRISMATCGRTKNGKSHWAVMTSPEPVAYIMLDPGSREIATKAAAMGKKIVSKFIDHSKKDNQETAKKVWAEYRASIRAIMATKSIRTLVVDTIDECWEIIQLAEFGKLKQNNKFAYGGVNAEFGGLIDEVYFGREDLNTIYIQKVKKSYIDDKWDGKTFKPAGFSSLDYLVDMSIEHFFREKNFGFRTLATEATRFGAQFSGLEFYAEENSFLDLALHIFNPANGLVGYDPVGADPFYWQ
jgi:hypothetical protein